MGRIGLLMLVMLVSAACNLSRAEVAAVPTGVPAVTEEGTPHATRTPIPFGITALPTLLPLPDGSGSIIIATPQPTLVPVTSVPPLGSVCQVYTTYSGVDPRNSLSLRTSPSISAPQIFRVPTNAQVLLVPAANETEGDGYHWLNVIYVDTSQVRYLGWMARDSFSTNGVRDPSIATLRPTAASSAC